VMRAWRWFSLIACSLCMGVAWTPLGRADEGDKKACAAAFANAQRQMRSGNLIEAKKSLILCGGPQCPTAMHPDCQQWLSSVESSIATVVFRVSSASGPPPSEVVVSVDGGEAVRLDGRAVSVDPGAHEVSVEAPGYRTTTKRIVVSEGDRLRNELVILAPLEEIRREDHDFLPGQAIPLVAQSTEAPSSRWTLPIVIASSVAVLGGLGAVYFGVKARSDDRQLESCTPDCTWDAVDRVKREYLWTNLSIGLAAAGITTATLLWVIKGHPGRATNRPATTTLGLGAGPSGLGPVVTGRF
jgi:hypothetical protein